MTEPVKLEDIVPHIMGTLFKHDNPSQYPQYHRTRIRGPTDKPCIKLYNSKDRRKVTTQTVLLFVARLLGKYGVEVDTSTKMVQSWIDQGVLK